MFNAIIQGIGLGLLMCVLVGPVFFALISITLHYGKRAAIWFATGTAVSDLLYAIAVFLTVGAFHLSSTAKWRMGVIGGIIFAIMGGIMVIRTLRHAKEAHADLHLRKHPHPLSLFSQGFLTNILNPSVLIFRAGAVSTSAATLERKEFIPILIATTLIVFFSTDLIKIQLAGKLQSMLRGKTLYRLHLATGTLLIIFGAGICIKTLLTHHVS